MNIFVTDISPIESAKALADKHVVKMILETAQMLSTAARIHGSANPVFYKPTHAKHPCTIAVINDSDYRQWAILHGVALCQEYNYRYNKQHKSKTVIIEAMKFFDSVKSGDWSRVKSIPLAMPTEFKSDNPFASYQKYLSNKYKSWGNAKWTTRQPPNWLNQ